MLALVNLAREYGQGPVPISRIAGTEKIPQRFLEGILLELKNEGILDSIRGKTGGYFLAVDPVSVSLSDIVTQFEGSMGMLACACDNSYQPCEFCKEEESCKIRKTFLSVHDSTAAILEKTTLADLV